MSLGFGITGAGDNGNGQGNVNVPCAATTAGSTIILLYGTRATNTGVPTVPVGFVQRTTISGKAFAVWEYVNAPSITGAAIITGTSTIAAGALLEITTGGAGSAVFDSTATNASGSSTTPTSNADQTVATLTAQIACFAQATNNAAGPTFSNPTNSFVSKVGDQANNGTNTATIGIYGILRSAVLNSGCAISSTVNNTWQAACLAYTFLATSSGGGQSNKHNNLLSLGVG